MVLTPYQFQQLSPKEQIAVVAERGIDLALTLGDEEQESRLACVDGLLVEMTFDSATLAFLGGLPVTDPTRLLTYLEDVSFAGIAA